MKHNKLNKISALLVGGLFLMTAAVSCAKSEKPLPSPSDIYENGFELSEDAFFDRYGLDASTMAVSEKEHSRSYTLTGTLPLVADYPTQEADFTFWDGELRSTGYTLILPFSEDGYLGLMDVYASMKETFGETAEIFGTPELENFSDFSDFETSANTGDGFYGSADWLMTNPTAERDLVEHDLRASLTVLTGTENITVTVSVYEFKSEYLDNK